MKYGKTRLGILIGAITASLYAAYAALVYVVVGPDANGDEGVSLWAIIATYYVSGIVGGGVIGALSRFGRSRAGLAALGMLGGCIVFICMGVATNGAFWNWSGQNWGIAIGLGTSFGLVAAYAYHNALPN